ncbi:DNA cytosine methyltransferase [Romboutsia maritimum]|uniref:DNA (cytosine-5-)-methyltransferase n=1 Tax=Romboutsia maritimum TaxID=2020948 RepID=A0A371IPS7_9FIRM|nr:DNA cytosine methyltransferase [Romboutsia maritimum]RDY22473.1 DNA cytosine methyltransferase [Romboutsia maritimum]
MYKVIDLFSGIGGLSLGFRLEGFEISIANEIDASIAESYKKNHPETYVINQDITELEIESVFKDFHNSNNTIVIGGPPCQGFSQKGSRLGLDDTRNYLFKYFFNVVDYVKPQYFVMENVPNMLTACNGYFKNEIVSLFNKIGYSIDYGILNSYDYGVPQERRRAFILGKKGDIKLNLPKPIDTKVSAWDAISDLSYLESGEGEFLQDYKINSNTSYQKLMRCNSKILYNHTVTKHSELALERLKLIPPEQGREVLPPEHITGSIFSGTWSRIIKSKPSVTITTRFDTPSSGRFSHPYLNRAITVREAARLQSFPDDIIFYGNKSSQMKQVGNAVPPLLAQEIAKKIKKDINND